MERRHPRISFTKFTLLFVTINSDEGSVDIDCQCTTDRLTHSRVVGVTIIAVDKSATINS